jgi:hypothetical protein
MLLPTLQPIQMHEAGVASSSTAFAPKFVKNDHFLQNLKLGINAHKGCSTHKPPFSFLKLMFHNG